MVGIHSGQVRGIFIQDTLGACEISGRDSCAVAGDSFAGVFEFTVMFIFCAARFSAGLFLLGRGWSGAIGT